MHKRVRDTFTGQGLRQNSQKNAATQDLECTKASEARLQAKDCVKMRSKTLRRRTYNAQKRPRHVCRPRTASKCAAKRYDAGPILYKSVRGSLTGQGLRQNAQQNAATQDL